MKILVKDCNGNLVNGKVNAMKATLLNSANKKRAVELVEAGNGLYTGNFVGPVAGKYKFDLQVDRKPKDLVDFEVLPCIDLSKTTVTGIS